MRPSSPIRTFYLAVLLLIAGFLLGTLPLRAYLGAADRLDDHLIVDLSSTIDTPTPAPTSSSTPTPTWDGTPFTPTPTLSSAQETQTAVAETLTYQATAQAVTLTVIAQLTKGEPTLTGTPTGTPTWNGTPFTATPTLSPAEETRIAAEETRVASEATATRVAYFATETAIAAYEATLGIDTRTPQPTETPTPTGTPTSPSIPTETPTPPSTPTETPTSDASPDTTRVATPLPTVTPTATPAPTVVATVAIDPETPTTTAVGTAQGLQQGQAMVIGVPGGAVGAPTILTVGIFEQPPAASPRFALGTFVFNITAEQNGQTLASLTFARPITLTIDYRDEDILGLDEEALTLHFYNEETQQWEDEGIAVLSRDAANNRIVVTIAHLTIFGLIDPSPRLLLPMVLNKTDNK